VIEVYTENVEGSVPVEETEFWKEMDKNRVGNLLAGARLKAGLTQGQLARKLGIRQNMVSDYERGRRGLSPGMAARFSDVLHIKGSHLKSGGEQQAGH
jgi:transcriptional regulator with XRE-family HTH domain